MSASSMNPETSSSVIMEVMKNDASHGQFNVSIKLYLLSCYILAYHVLVFFTFLKFM